MRTCTSSSPRARSESIICRRERSTICSRTVYARSVVTARLTSTLCGTQDVATFLLVRGRYAWMGYGWLGCTDKYEKPDALQIDAGEPLDPICRETDDGVFVRHWSKKTVTMDCNTWTATIEASNVTRHVGATGGWNFWQLSR